jgi:hypothetical protein
MLASTRLTQRRIEREEVDRYLAAHERAARAGAAHRSQSGARAVAGR